MARKETTQDERAASRARLLFAAKFLGLITLFYAILVIPAVDRGFVSPFTTSLGRVSALLMRLAGEEVASIGTSLRQGTFAVEIRNGCNALEACLVLISAVLAFPAPWKRRVVGVIAGLGIIQTINLLRIISLFVIARDHPRWFEVAHVYVWQTAMFLLAVAIFVYWSRPRAAAVASPA